MFDLEIEPTRLTPHITFSLAEGRLSIVGNSYPSDVAHYYQPIIDKFAAWLAEGSIKNVHIVIHLNYLNSTSLKFLTMLLELFQANHEAGHKVTVEWVYEPEDDDIHSAGEDLSHAVTVPVKLVANTK